MTKLIKVVRVYQQLPDPYAVNNEASATVNEDEVLIRVGPGPGTDINLVTLIIGTKQRVVDIEELYKAMNDIRFERAKQRKLRGW